MQIHIKNDHFLSTPQIESICCVDRTLFGRQTLDPNVWTFARRIAFICAKLSSMCIRGTLTCIRVTPISNLTIGFINPRPSLPPPPPPPPSLPPPPPPPLPPLLSSCLAPLSHRYRRRRRFRCSLLIVVCPRRCPAATAAYNHYRLRRRRFHGSLFIVGCPRRCHCRRR